MALEPWNIVIAAIDGKKSEQTDDRIEDIGDNARNRALVKEARDLIKSLSTSVKNRFRRDPEILAEWATASRIHRTGGSGRRKPRHPPRRFLDRLTIRLSRNSSISRRWSCFFPRNPNHLRI